MSARPHDPLPPDAPHALRGWVQGWWLVPAAVIGLTIWGAIFLLLF